MKQYSMNIIKQEEKDEVGYEDNDEDNTTNYTLDRASVALSGLRVLTIPMLKLPFP